MKNPLKSLLLASSVAALLTAPAISSANSGVEKLTKNPANWATALGNYAGTRYSKLDQINAKNVKNLQPAWSFSTGVLRGHEGGPLVIGDVIYIHTPFPNTVYALDQATRSVIWEYTPQMDADVTIPVMCCDTVNRGLAYGDGKIFLQQSDTVLTALDAKTGKRIWSVQNGDPKLGMTNTQAPLVVNDKIITGIAGGEFGVRGFLAAYDMKSGQLAWKGYSMGPDGDTIINPNKTTTWENGKVTKVGKNSGTNTWEGDQWKIGGGTTWGWYSYDPDLNLVYYGSGNPSTWNPVQRPGDNKWSMSLWARDADTGEVKWVYQMTPHDEWDFDGINEVVLADQKIGGKMRKTIVHFDRNGFGYTLDRVTGELLVAEKFDKTVNWATHIDMKSGRPVLDLKYSTEANGEDENTEGACPAALGSKNQQPVSYSPQTKLFYISANHLCMDYEPFEVSYTAGQPYVGATLTMMPAGGDAITGKKDGSTNLGQFTAWDATTGKIVWSNKETFSVWSGSVATAGGVVFYGTLEGYLKAVDAKTGKELYKFKTPSGIIGNVNTWSYKGKQYVGVLSGIGGWAGIGIAAGLDSGESDSNSEGLGAVGAYRSLSSFTKLGGVFTVFALPGK
ncbi:alcohol dehydrogenase (cytochrome c) [Bathymodiolus platifrons methanotrophic gill symbiont]|uniref:methanol/ethanol family PQQ-dependent dehydrogenase n=1 Tax=Bathymodiolus platifrons methanotrophic gill symbiont TaxID=113268 RepID=UPI000B416613|nr:methanol/ethanol family PQQ-dependent dehydrogenase [Bathymodiolus platifrons methanotrophic gill symbiont]GAW85368.1 alcohol dehydrogenase (cytochrome c) [Bathymodiolus platifrons methanotrophic gill symbiont]GFO76646.1 lanthanide-dependent methanol dehydrogenase [Bathymodiolus platifrons methanotrophic gill symbiont]